MTASQPVPATRRAAPELTVRRSYTSQPDSSIASRVHRRSARKAAEVGTMSSAGASQGEREIVDLTIPENRPSQTSTHPISWCTPDTLWAKFGPGFMAVQQQTVGSSNNVVVPTIDQAIQRVEERKKRKTAQKK
ncbi:hypothetical protein CJ030_MR8G002233 [Morella rubra]|uniref:Uncharacterized protein n=1 Tax=Morella rubra TaxID=262757 RepID=A0A6A1UR54_9ROSI|nr:hypothetical protein CJ030_MR8G002233 [Morella rubra]